MKAESGDFFTDDSATLNLIEHWFRVRDSAIKISGGDALSLTDEGAISVGEVPQSAPMGVPEILIQATVVLFGEKVSEGQLIAGVAIPWFEIITRMKQDPEFLFKIDWRKLEEIIAGAYEREGWPEVILTPRSGDRGRDIIATRPGFGSLRIVDQIKAYNSGHLVSADEVRSMLGVLQTEANVSKGLVTTTARFAPGIERDDRLKAVIPYRLELKDGVQLQKWLVDVATKGSRND